MFTTSNLDPEIRFISSGGPTESVASTFTLGQTVFQFSRTSSSPLTSLIIIDNVTTSFNGTRVECSYRDRVMSTTIINVIGNGIIIHILTVQCSVATKDMTHQLPLNSSKEISIT